MFTNWTRAISTWGTTLYYSFFCFLIFFNGTSHAKSSCCHAHPDAKQAPFFYCWGIHDAKPGFSRTRFQSISWLDSWNPGHDENSPPNIWCLFRFCVFFGHVRSCPIKMTPFNLTKSCCWTAERSSGVQSAEPSIWPANLYIDIFVGKQSRNMKNW